MNFSVVFEVSFASRVMSYYKDYFDPVKFGSLHKLISVKLPRYGDTKIDVLKVRPFSH